MFRQIPLLSIVTWLPLAGAIVVAALPARFAASIARVATTWAWLAFAASLALLGYDRAAGGFQFVEDATWIAPLGARYSLGVDGISLVLVLLTTFLVAIASLASTSSIRERRREFYVLLLAAETALVGVFVSLDLFLFYVFWAVALVPVSVLVVIWGGERRRYAAAKLFVYTLAGSRVMALAILQLSATTKAPATRASLAAIEQRAAEITAEESDARSLVDRALEDIGRGKGSFNVLALHAVGGARDRSGAPVVPVALQFWLFAGLFAGFALLVPLFPFHTWLPDAHAEAPTGVSVLLAGVFLELGGYGFVRFSLPILPDASRDPRVSGVVAALAIAGIVYGALAAIYYAARAGDMK
jgi:NADH-quinone oxidoreductase subunit M